MKTISELYSQHFEKKISAQDLPNALINSFSLKENIHVVFKENKGWVFDYENSVLYTLTQTAALFIFAFLKGHNYNEIINVISRAYNVPLYMVDSNFQELLTDMFQQKLISLVS